MACGSHLPPRYRGLFAVEAAAAAAGLRVICTHAFAEKQLAKRSVFSIPVRRGGGDATCPQGEAAPPAVCPLVDAANFVWGNRGPSAGGSPTCLQGEAAPIAEGLPTCPQGEAASPAKSPLVGEASIPTKSPAGEVDGSRDDAQPVCVVKWPRKLATNHAHFMKEESGTHFLCWRGQPAKQIDHLDGGDDIRAALTGGRPACKRCMRALPRRVRDEVLRLSAAAAYEKKVESSWDQEGLPPLRL